MRIFSGRQIGRGKKRNRRIEENICQHRKKDQSQVQTSKILKIDLWPFLKLILYFLTSSLQRSFIPYPSSFCIYDRVIQMLSRSHRASIVSDEHEHELRTRSLYFLQNLLSWPRQSVRVTAK